MQATQWMNRTAQGPKWKPESAALRSRLLHAFVYRSFVYYRRAQGCHRGVKNGCQSVRQKAKSCGRGRKRCQFLLYRLLLLSCRKNCACRDRHMDTNAKSKRKEKSMQEQQKSVVETDSNPLKLSIQGHPGEMRQAVLRDGRQPRCPGPSLGNRPRSLPKEKSRSSRRRILCSYLHASSPTISEHNPKFSARKKLPDCLLSDLFSSTTMTGTDGSRP